MKLPPTWELPEEIKKRCGTKRIGRQRAMAAEGHLLLILHKLPQRGMREREAAFFWRKPSGEWRATERGDGLHGLRQHLESYGQAEEKWSAEFSRADEADEFFRLLQEVGPLSHAATGLHNTLQAAREAVAEDRDIIDLRDQAYDLARNLELLHTEIRHALDFHVARKAEEQLKLSLQSLQSERRLNILAALFFPLTAIASLFGMNLRSGLEEMAFEGFWLIFAVTILLGLLTCAWVLQGHRKATSSNDNA